MHSLPPKIGNHAAFVALSHVNSTCIYWIGNCRIVAQVPRFRATQTVQGCDAGSAIRVIGENPKGHIGKKLVMRQCRAMGWSPIDDNEADALATWHYMCALIEPKLAMAPTPLFGRGMINRRATL